MGISEIWAAVLAPSVAGKAADLAGLGATLWILVGIVAAIIALAAMLRGDGAGGAGAEEISALTEDTYFPARLRAARLQLYDAGQPCERHHDQATRDSWVLLDAGGWSGSARRPTLPA